MIEDEEDIRIFFPYSDLFKCFEQLERFIYILALRFPNIVIMMSNESPASRLSNGTLVIIYGKGPMEIHLEH